jgi:predicted GNAT family N-acyltransferase
VSKKAAKPNLSQQLYNLEVEWGTPEYDQVIDLRTMVLRIPLGLEFSTEELEKEYQDKHFGCYHTETQSLVGCMKLSVSAEARQTARMKQVAVLPSFQGMGVGQFMVAYFEQYCMVQGFSDIALHARAEAAPFYEKLGYKTIGAPFTEVGIKHFAMEKAL